MKKSNLFILLTLLAFVCPIFPIRSARAWQVTISDCPGCGSRAEAAVVDAAGDIIATGSFFYGSDIVKLSGATGQLIWRFEVMGHESRNYVQDIAIDSHGDVFVVFAWTRSVVKVSGADGTKIWEKPVGGTLNAFLPLINAVVVDRDDNVITAGTMGGYFNVCKLDGRTGDEKWHYDARGGYASGVAVARTGEVAAAGMMNNNFATVKLSADGHEIWYEEINGEGNFTDVFEEARAVRMGDDGSVVVAGVTVGVTGEFRDCTKDFTVAKYFPDGTKWIRTINGSLLGRDDRGNIHNGATDEANAVIIDNNGDVIAAGSYQVSPDVGVNAPEHFQVFKLSGVNGQTIWGSAADETPLNEIHPFGRAFALSVDGANEVAAVGVHEGSFTVVKFRSAASITGAGERAWPRPFMINTGSTGGSNAVSVLMDADKNVVATGETVGSDNWSKFTVVKLRGTDGADYFAEPTPTPTQTPTVPETVLKYAPLVYLHPTDDYRPGNPLTFIQNSKLAWSHQSTAGGFPCGDHGEAEQGAIDASRLGVASSSPYVHKPKDTSSPICHHIEDIELKAYEYTRPFDGSKRDNILGDLRGYMKEGFYLDPVDDNELRRGIGVGAPVFFEYVERKYVTYWFFYPYDLFRIEIPGELSVPSQFHEGDWESISVQLDENDSPVNVYYSAHDDGMLLPWGGVDKYADTHPIVFSAKGSHGSFPIVGEFPTKACIPGTKRCAPDRTAYDSSWKWITWSNLLQVETQPWYGFGGAWGEVGEDPIEIFGLSGKDYTGPLGPSNYKNSRGQWSFAVSGRVTGIDGRGMNGVTLTLADAQGNEAARTSTDANGSYFFADLRFGRTYAVVPSKESYSFSPVTEVLTNLRENQTANFRALDTTPPVLNLPSDMTANANIPQGATVYYNVTATDNGTKDPQVGCVPSTGSPFPIGTTNVACTATDDAGNQATETFKIIVKGAADQITDLITLVKGFGLQNGIENSLVVKLKNALSKAKAWDKAATCKQLGSFINEVEAQGRKKISVTQAHQMLKAANRIRAVLGC